MNPFWGAGFTFMTLTRPNSCGLVRAKESDWASFPLLAWVRAREELAAVVLRVTRVVLRGRLLVLLVLLAVLTLVAFLTRPRGFFSVADSVFVVFVSAGSA